MKDEKWDENEHQYDLEIHKQTKNDKQELTKLQRRKRSVGKQTSRGYKGKPDEIVEVRGD